MKNKTRKNKTKKTKLEKTKLEKTKLKNNFYIIQMTLKNHLTFILTKILMILYILNILL